MKIHRYVIAISIIVLVVLIAINCTSKKHKKEMKTTHVDCDAGQSLKTVVAQSPEHTRIIVKGNTCQIDGSVIVTQNNIVIDGNGAVLEGQDLNDPVIIIQAKNVVIKDLTVTRGNHGIVIEKGATAVLKNVNANGNKGSGIVLGKPMRLPNPGENSNQTPGTKPLTLNDSTDNTLSGLFGRFFERSRLQLNLISEARAAGDGCQFCELLEGLGISIGDIGDIGESSTLCGTNNFNDNQDIGFLINNNKTKEICGTVHMENTASGFSQPVGLVVEDSSAVNIHSGGFITAINHDSNGIQVTGGSKIEVEDSGTLTSMNNGGYGLLIGDESKVKCYSSTSISLSGNASPVKNETRLENCNI